MGCRQAKYAHLNYRPGVANYSPATPLPNPNPNKWSMLKSEQFGKYCVLKIKYPDCTNYEGIKLLVFRSTIDRLIRQSTIDPHFGDDKKLIYPIARFQPTEEGWSDAVNFIHLKDKQNG